MRPRPLNTKASKILNLLTKDVGYGQGRKIDNTDGVYMPVHVEQPYEGIWTVAHYGKRNGDLMSDPEVLFWKRDGEWFPIEIVQHYFGSHQVVMEVMAGNLEEFSPSAYEDLRVFCNGWMINILEQQNLDLDVEPTRFQRRLSQVDPRGL